MYLSHFLVFSSVTGDRKRQEQLKETHMITEEWSESE